MVDRKLRLGIAGLGRGFTVMLPTLAFHPRLDLVAAVDTRPAAGVQFEADFGGKSYTTVEAMCAKADIDAIYVATPHQFHAEHTEIAARAGKHILVEKPMALDHPQAAEMVALARKKGLFLAEALWTYFLPKFDVLDQIIASGTLGEIKSIHTEYGEYFTRDHRIFRPDLAGGPLYDLGTYPISLLTRLMGVPKQVLGMKQDDESGVHGQLSVILSDARGNQGTMSTTLYGLTPTNAAIVGTGGTVRFGSEFNLPGPFEVLSADGSIRLNYEETPGRHFEGLFYEAAEVARAIAAGKTETTKRPLGATLDMMQTLDLIRRELQI